MFGLLSEDDVNYLITSPNRPLPLTTSPNRPLPLTTSPNRPLPLYDLTNEEENEEEEESDLITSPNRPLPLYDLTNEEENEEEEEFDLITSPNRPLPLTTSPNRPLPLYDLTNEEENEEEESDLITFNSSHRIIPTISKFEIFLDTVIRPSFFVKKQKENEINGDGEECAICFENMISGDMVKLNCGHKFCGECITTTLQKTHNPRCALCRVPIKKFGVINQDIVFVIGKFNFN